MSDFVDHPEEYFRQFLPKSDRLLAGLEEETRPIIPCRYNLLTCKFLYYRDFKYIFFVNINQSKFLSSPFFDNRVAAYRAELCVETISKGLTNVFHNRNH
jgi:hypothetical protein